LPLKSTRNNVCAGFKVSLARVPHPLSSVWQKGWETDSIEPRYCVARPREMNLAVQVLLANR